MKIAVIGSPGSGKTTLSNGIFYFLKKDGKHVEIVPELIKYKVYKGEVFSDDGFDIQNTLEQKNFEKIFDQAIKNGQLEYIICEAPLCNGYFYASFYKKKLERDVLKKIASESINSYDIILFVQTAPKAEYVTFGRKESKSKSRKLQAHIEKEFKKLGFKNDLYYITQQTDMEIVLDLINKRPSESPHKNPIS